MAPQRREDNEPQGPPGRFADDLVGLDPDDPEAQEFAAHLNKMERPNSRATVEGMLEGVDDFAQSANRTSGHRRAVVILVVALILVGIVFSVWKALLYMIGTFFG